MDKKGSIIINNDWKEILKAFFDNRDGKELLKFIKRIYSDKSEIIFPKFEDLFNAFNLTAFSHVKVVILGQDPYHNDLQAHGLAFSVCQNTVLPPSLKNIYKEIEGDLGIRKDLNNGNLENWAKQGVFLLNSILTVKAHKPASHKGQGWEKFTDYIIKTLSDKGQSIVFILWGNNARSKKYLIDNKRHLILEAAHPSPFSANNGFFGSKHFSKANKYLKEHRRREIDW